MPSGRSASDPISSTIHRFRELLDDVSQIQDIFLEELRALSARVRELESRNPSSPPLLTLPISPNSDASAMYFESMEGIIRGWSRGAESLYGYAAGEILGKSSYALSPSHSYKHASGKPVIPPAYPRMRKGGQLFFVNALHTPIEDAERMTLGYLVQEIPITGSLEAGAES